MSTPTPSTRRPRGSLIVLVVLAVAWVLWAIWWASAPDHNANGQCEGLGWGCTLTPRDFASFAGAILLAPLSALALFVTGVVRLVRIGKGSARTLWDLVIGALLLAGAAWFLVGLVRGAI
ncbi:hypothetical protein [Knoellia subterranea]|uniref:Uncharacterized protein n=1 Tax=Knoellia subterranea KCTC 19937 TaxID=1385521 RepID=A0A0A0JNZ2_9MICO|nr:hypothetical protein [Knoellia subterranea]KGN38873.1 hypothetical protein N803_08045 [Knoellia subterranea KCTC 19937]